MEIQDGLTRCGTCGHDIAPADAVRCARCELPVHRDCWNYQGRCSAFGCGSRAYFAGLPTALVAAPACVEITLPPPRGRAFVRAGAGTFAMLVCLFLARMVIPLPWRFLFEITLLLAPAISFAIAAFAYDRASDTLRLNTRDGELTLVSTNGLSTRSRLLARTTPATGRIIVSRTGRGQYDVSLDSCVLLSFRHSRTGGRTWLEALHRLAEALDVPIQLPDDPWVRAEYQRLDVQRVPERRQLPPKS